MKESFLTFWRGLWRGHSATVALVFACACVFSLPDAVRADGTEEGLREMHLKFAVGSAYAVAFLSALVWGCGAFAREREAKTLALTAVRPVTLFGVAVGKWAAAVLAAALVLAVSGTVLFVFPQAPCCRHHRLPVLPPAVEVAKAQMAGYLADPATPDEVRKAPRAAVLALLVNKERERFEGVPAGGSASWTFDGPGTAVRIRFTTPMDQRVPVTGVFRCDGGETVVSNASQTISETALAARTSSLVFENRGANALMLRPRRDVELLDAADAFAFNFLRAVLVLFCVIALSASFGVFLSAAVSRPVALFTAIVWIVVTLIAPSAVQQFPDEFHASFSEKAGLWISRRAVAITSAFSDVSPIADLATDRCIEWRDVLRALLVDLIAGPALFLGAAAFLVRRRPL